MEREAAFLAALAAYGIRLDMQEVLVRGNPDLGIRPGALTHALAAIQAVQMEAVGYILDSELDKLRRGMTTTAAISPRPYVKDDVPIFASPVPSSGRAYEAWLSASRKVPHTEEHWGAEPDLRAVVKMEIAEQIGRMARVRDLIDWQVKDLGDGRIEVTGLVSIALKSSPSSPEEN